MAINSTDALSKTTFCKPSKCSGFYPWGAKFCHICGKPFHKSDIQKANEITGKEDMIL